jgi:hypothetical protein
LSDSTCESRVLRYMESNSLSQKYKHHQTDWNIILQNRIGFTNQLHTFLNDKLVKINFKEITRIQSRIHLNIIPLIQGVYIEFGKLLSNSLSEVINVAADHIIPTLNFSMILEPQIEKSVQNMKQCVKFIQRSLIINGNIEKVKQFQLEQEIYKVSVPIRTVLDKFEKLIFLLKNVIYNLGPDATNRYWENHHAEVLQNVSYLLPDLSKLQKIILMQKMTSLAGQLEQAIEEMVYDHFAMHLRYYLDEFSGNLTRKPILNERVFKMVTKWRENSINLTPLKNNRFRKLPIMGWYVDLFRPSTNDTWLEKLTYFEKLLYQIYELDEIDPEMANFYRKNLTVETANSSAYQRRVNDLYENMKTNITIAVIKALMINNINRVDNVIRHFNPVVTKVIIERLFVESRASKDEIDQQKRSLAKQNYAVVNFKEFMYSFENYFKILDIPLPAAEWDEMMAVLAEFNNVSDLSNETWIVPKMTTHQWGRELIGAREVCNQVDDNQSCRFAESCGEQ